MTIASENVGNLAKSLAAAQASFPRLDRNRTVHTKSYSFDYATLDHVIDVVKPVLAQNGLAYVQLLGGDGKTVEISTRLMHESNEWIEGTFRMPVPDEASPQDVGKVVTYARRYALCAILGVSAEEDSDANLPSGGGVTFAERTQPTDTSSQARRPSQEMNDDRRAVIPTARPTATPANGPPKGKCPERTCPRCGATGYVRKNTESGDFYCWKNAERDMHGCGAKDIQFAEFNSQGRQAAKPQTLDEEMDALIRKESSNVGRLNHFLWRLCAVEVAEDANSIVNFVSAGAYETIDQARASEEDASAVLNAAYDTLRSRKVVASDLREMARRELELTVPGVI